MLTRNIECCGCQTEGEIEIVWLAPQARPDRRFKYIGYHEFTGDLYFRCPSCQRDVVVNPMEALGPGKIKGIPRFGAARSETPCILR